MRGRVWAAAAARQRAAAPAIPLLLCAAALSPTLVRAAETWNAAAALATRYVSRGLDLTDGPPAASLGGEYRPGPSTYLAGAFQSLDYFNMNAEVDASVGWRAGRGPLRYDLGLYYYEFPGRAGERTHASYGEAGLRLSWVQGPVVPVAELYLSPDYFFGSGFGVYVDAGADLALPRALTLAGRYGYTRVSRLEAFQYPNYGNWSLTLLRALGAWDLSLQLTDTTISRAGCLNENRCSLKVTVRFGRRFGG